MISWASNGNLGEIVAFIGNIGLDNTLLHEFKAQGTLSFLDKKKRDMLTSTGKVIKQRPREHAFKPYIS